MDSFSRLTASQLLTSSGDASKNNHWLRWAFDSIAKMIRRIKDEKSSAPWYTTALFLPILTGIENLPAASSDFISLMLFTFKTATAYNPRLVPGNNTIQSQALAYKK